MRTCVGVHLRLLDGGGTPRGRLRTYSFYHARFRRPGYAGARGDRSATKFSVARRIQAAGPHSGRSPTLFGERGPSRPDGVRRPVKMFIAHSANPDAWNGR